MYLGSFGSLTIRDLNFTFILTQSQQPPKLPSICLYANELTAKMCHEMS